MADINPYEILKNPKVAKNLGFDIEQKSSAPIPFFIQSLFMAFGLVFVYIFMFCMVDMQYQQPIELMENIQRGLYAYPAFLGAVYPTHKFSGKKWMQLLLLIGSWWAAFGMIWNIKYSKTYGEMQKCAGLATAWIYGTMQMELVPCLVTVAGAMVFWLLG